MNDIIKRPAPALALGEALLKMLTDPTIPADKMKIVLDAQREIMAENRREQFFSSFAEMAVEMPHIEKRGKVELIKDGKKLGGYRYMKWEDMDTVVRPIMHRFGFSLSFSQRVEQGKQIMVGTLMHEAGHSVISERPIIPDPGPGRNAAQAEGSGTTYAKRYIGEGLLNIIRFGGDDDGINTGLAPIDDSQVKELTKLLKETGTKADYFMNMFVTGVESLKDIQARDFPRLKNALEAKKEAQARLPREPKK